MSQDPFSWELFARAPLIGIVRNLSLAEVSALLPLYRDAGLTTIEITMNTPDADAIIRYALDYHRTGGGVAPAGTPWSGIPVRHRAFRPAGGLNIGAGTVCTVADLERALAAGAQFIVTPILNKRVIRSCVRRGIPIMPGAFTPSEIYEAWSLGASLVKVFPATSLGPAFIGDLKAPLSQIRLLPTGGITLDNMADFMKAGADGVGVGSQLFDRTLIGEQNWTGLRAHFQQFVDQLTATSRPTRTDRPIGL